MSTADEPRVGHGRDRFHCRCHDRGFATPSLAYLHELSLAAGEQPAPGEQITLGFDGSLSDDTAVVMVRRGSDGSMRVVDA